MVNWWKKSEWYDIIERKSVAKSGKVAVIKCSAILIKGITKISNENNKLWEAILNDPS